MNMTPTKYAEKIVLSNLLGNEPDSVVSKPYDLHPYAKQFPDNLIVTFEEGKDGRVYRVFFALYGNDGNFTAELGGLSPKWTVSDFRGKSPSLIIKRPSEVNHNTLRHSEVVTAFEELARIEYAKRKGKEVQPEDRKENAL